MHAKIHVLPFFFLLLSLNTGLWAQAQAEKPKRNANDPLVFKSIKQQGDAVTLEYSIPFEGVVGFELMDADEKIVWRNQYVNLPGDNSIRFSTKPLIEGKYYYTLYYKGRETRKYFDYRAGN